MEGSLLPNAVFPAHLEGSPKTPSSDLQKATPLQATSCLKCWDAAPEDPIIRDMGEECTPLSQPLCIGSGPDGIARPWDGMWAGGGVPPINIWLCRIRPWASSMLGLWETGGEDARCRLSAKGSLARTVTSSIPVGKVEFSRRGGGQMGTLAGSWAVSLLAPVKYGKDW